MLTHPKSRRGLFHSYAVRRHGKQRGACGISQKPDSDALRRGPNRMNHQIGAVHPVLMSSSVSDSLRFFERLGFGERFRDDAVHPRYAVVSRDAAELHLQWQDSSQWAYPIDRPTYRFLVRDVDALFAEFLQVGICSTQGPSRSPWASPGDTPWGTREFHVLDPDGNGLQFYRSSARVTPSSE